MRPLASAGSASAGGEAGERGPPAWRSGNAIGICDASPLHSCDILLVFTLSSAFSKPCLGGRPEDPVFLKGGNRRCGSATRAAAQLAMAFGLEEDWRSG